MVTGARTLIFLILFALVTFAVLVIQGAAGFVAAFICWYLFLAALPCVVLGLSRRWTLVRLATSSAIFTIVAFIVVTGLLVLPRGSFGFGGKAIVENGVITADGLLWVWSAVWPISIVFLSVGVCVMVADRVWRAS